MSGKRIAFYSRFAGGVVAAVLVVAIVLGYGLIQKVRIGGSIYTDLIAGKDVTADVLPPPLYIIESYLEASSAMLDPVTGPSRRARFEQLKADYDTRHVYWQDFALTPALKSALLEASYDPARRFYEIGLTAFFPALETGDLAAARDAYADMSKAYADHRAEIDRVVALAADWYMATETDAKATIPLALTVIGGLALTIVGLLAAATVLGERTIVRPIGRVAEAMRHLAEGRTDITLPALGTTREMQDLSAAMGVFAVNARERAHLLEELQEGRLEAEKSRATLEQLAVNFLGDADAMKTVLDREAHVVRSCAKAFGRTVDMSETEAGEGLASSVAAAESVRTVATATGQLSSSTRQIARQSEEARRITDAASDRAKSAEREVQALTAVADQIKSILEAIGGIASQTNLLSLNATIEASRAGEAGRGFAVVAAEVKTLAGETAKATAEVDRLLQEINGCTSAVVESIGRIVGDVGAVSALNTEIAHAIAEQEKATTEIAQSAEQASLSTDGTRETNEKLSKVVRDARSEVQRVFDASKSLFEVLAEFSEGTNRFLGTISQDMKERRAHVRHKAADQAIVVVDGRRMNSAIRDLSLSGAAVAKVPGVTTGTRLTLVLGGRDIPADCIWTDDGHFGVRFREALSEFPIELRKAG